MWILVIFLWTASHSCYVEIFIDLWELCFLEKFALIFYTFFFTFACLLILFMVRFISYHLCLCVFKISKSPSVQFSRSVVSDSLRPHESQHSRPSCPSPTPEFTKTHVHRVSDAIQSSHPLSFPSLSAPNPSQHQGLFQWVNSSSEVAKVLEFQLQQSFLKYPLPQLFHYLREISLPGFSDRNLSPSFNCWLFMLLLETTYSQAHTW